MHTSRGVDVKSRLLTDYMSGRSDRVVTEDEADDFGAFEKVYSLAMGNPEAQSWFPPVGEEATRDDTLRRGGELYHKVAECHP